MSLFPSLGKLIISYVRAVQEFTKEGILFKILFKLPQEHPQTGCQPLLMLSPFLLSVSPPQ